MTCSEMGCTEKIESLTKTAVDALSVFEYNDFLIWLTSEMADRKS